MIQLSFSGSATPIPHQILPCCCAVYVCISHVCQVHLTNNVVDTIPGKFLVDVEDFYELR